MFVATYIWTAYNALSQEMITLLAASHEAPLHMIPNPTDSAYPPKTISEIPLRRAPNLRSGRGFPLPVHSSDRRPLGRPMLPVHHKDELQHLGAESCPWPAGPHRHGSPRPSGTSFFCLEKKKKITTYVSQDSC